MTVYFKKNYKHLSVQFIKGRQYDITKELAYKLIRKGICAKENEPYIEHGVLQKQKPKKKKKKRSRKSKK